MTMTTKRSIYPDNSTALRAARRQALLDVAARRMGYKSWSALESQVRKVLEQATTNAEANNALYEIIADMRVALWSHKIDPDAPPADVLAALRAHPRKTRKVHMTLDQIVDREG